MVTFLYSESAPVAKFLNPVSSEISDLCENSDLLFFISYFASQTKGIKFGDYFFDVCCRDDHYLVCQLDIRHDSEFATASGYPKTAFRWEPDTDPDIRNAFIDILKITTFGKSCALHNHSLIIFRSIFSVHFAMTSRLSMV